MHQLICFTRSEIFSAIMCAFHTHTQFNQASGLCALTDAGAKQVLSSLLAELLFIQGKVTLCNLPHLYQDYFGEPLHLCGAKTFTDLMKHQLFSTAFEVRWISV